jgi:REP element-mobilizing transposase RayT
MTKNNFDPIHLQPRHRRSVRLKDRDYSAFGAYYITLCTQGKECWFGEVASHKVELTDVGEKTKEFLLAVPDHHPQVGLGEFVVMPNHVHSIILFTSRGVQLNAPTKPHNRPQKDNYFSTISPSPKSLGVVVRTYKGAVVNWCRKNDFGYFNWQRGYYEHVIRDEEDFQRIVEYIQNNPARWNLDIENPINFNKIIKPV